MQSRCSELHDAHRVRTDEPRRQAASQHTEVMNVAARMEAMYERACKHPPPPLPPPAAPVKVETASSSGSHEQAPAAEGQLLAPKIEPKETALAVPGGPHVQPLEQTELYVLPLLCGSNCPAEW